MPIALIARDKSGALQTRLDNRSAHLEYLDQTPSVMHAGPLLGDDEKPCGSIIILDMEMEDAKIWAQNDPYSKADLFASVELVRWNKVIG
ncbi:MAG: YciI family protein [Aliishimia sp.]